MKEIPKSYRHAGRPALSEIFKEGPRDKGVRATAIRKAVIEYVYTRKEIADFLRSHYSTISRTVNRMSYARNKTPCPL